MPIQHPFAAYYTCVQYVDEPSHHTDWCRRFLLEWLSFLCRYIPVGLLEVLPQKLNWRPPNYYGRSDLETLMASQRSSKLGRHLQAATWADAPRLYVCSKAQEQLVWQREEHVAGGRGREWLTLFGLSVVSL